MIRLLSAGWLTLPAYSASRSFALASLRDSLISGEELRLVDRGSPVHYARLIVSRCDGAPARPRSLPEALSLTGTQPAIRPVGARIVQDPWAKALPIQRLRCTLSDAASGRVRAPPSGSANCVIIRDAEIKRQSGLVMRRSESGPARRLRTYLQSLSTCAASLDSGRPRWDDAARGGAADGPAPVQSEPPPVRRGRGEHWAAGGVRAPAVAGGASAESRAHWGALAVR